MEHSVLTAYRAKRGWRMTDLARALNVNRSTILRWERDGIPLHRLRLVHEATKISFKALRPDLFSHDQ
jgi:transcriptional regulator with XRE-family HTH domain